MSNRNRPTWRDRFAGYRALAPRIPLRTQRTPSAHYTSMQRLFWPCFGLAVITALLVVPRPQTPHAVPLPPVDWRLLKQSLQKTEQRIQGALSHPLSLEVRGLGERIRRCGVLEWEVSRKLSGSQPRDVLQQTLIDERVIVRNVARTLVHAGQADELLSLRDLQFHLLSEAMKDQRAERDVVELGGRLAEHMHGAEALVFGRQLERATLHSLFVRRWAELVGLEQHPIFRSTANEHRLLQRFHARRLLARPLSEVSGELMRVLERAREFSPGFPADYAQGIVLYRTGAFGPALAAFNRHLERHPTGPWSLRAQNFSLGAASALVR